MKIDIISLESTDSTSSYVQGLLAESRSLPFCVHALSQTKGRGSRGRSWSSPSGNLYVSFAVSSQNVDPQREFGLIPLKSALMVALWIKKFLKLRVSLKWPNDIYFDGKKLGGILVETSVSGKEFSAFVIGVGINLNVLDTTLVDSSKATTLSHIVQYDLDVENSLYSLVETWQTMWDRVQLKDVLNLYAAYALEDGQPWRDKTTGDVYLTERYNVDGTMVLRRVDNGTQINVNSVNNEYEWLYSFSDVPMLLADVGNSRLKLAMYANHKDSEPTLFRSCDSKEEIRSLLLESRGVLSAQGINTKWPVHLVSVNDVQKTKLTQVCEELGFVISSVPKRRLRSIGTGYVTVDLGIDRLAGIEAFIDLYPRESGIVVSCGTAITVDCILQNREHIGGYILPGFQTSLCALNNNTDNLPKLGVDDLVSMRGVYASDVYAHNTEEAILKAQILSIQSILLKLRSIKGGYNKVVLTGGESCVISKILDAEEIPHLIVHGIKTLVTGG